MSTPNTVNSKRARWSDEDVKGVTLRHGASAKVGPPLLSSQDMSKRDYMDLVAANSTASGRAGSAIAASSARARAAGGNGGS